MLQAPNATIASITHEGDGSVTLRCYVPGDGQDYYFGVEGKGEGALAWLRTLSAGNQIPLAGLPFGRFNKARNRYEMWMTVEGAPQLEMMPEAHDAA